MIKKNLLLIIIVAVIFGGVCFYGGLKYEQSQSQGEQKIVLPTVVLGEIIAKDATSITVKAPDGSSKIALISNSTAITEIVKSSSNDLTVGKNVMVIGQTNDDGSITSNSIQLMTQLMPKTATQ